MAQRLDSKTGEGSSTVSSSTLLSESFNCGLKDLLDQSGRPSCAFIMIIPENIEAWFVVLAIYSQLSSQWLSRE